MYSALTYVVIKSISRVCGTRKFIGNKGYIANKGYYVRSKGYYVRGPAWLSGKVFDLQSRGPGFELHWILWVFSWECPWAGHFRAPA